MKTKIIPLFFVLAVFAMADPQSPFIGTWTGISGDLPQGATLVIGLNDAVYALKLTWDNGESWQGRSYLVKGILIGGFAYSEKDGGFFSVAMNGADILMNTFSVDLTKRTPKGINFRRKAQ